MGFYGGVTGRESGGGAAIKVGFCFSHQTGLCFWGDSEVVWVADNVWSAFGSFRPVRFLAIGVFLGPEYCRSGGQDYSNPYPFSVGCHRACRDYGGGHSQQGQSGSAFHGLLAFAVRLEA